MRWTLAAALLLGVSAPGPVARGEVAIGAGGALALDGPRLGLWAGAELEPGGWLGLRADVWAFRDQLLVEGAAAFTLGATRPHLAITLHLGGGGDLRRRGASLSAGLATQLGLGLGPLALFLDATAHAVLWPGDDRHDLVVTGVGGLVAAF